MNISTFQEWFRESETADKDWRDKAKDNLRFYIGRQWASDDLTKIQKEGRPALTINKIFPLINFLHGYQIQNRQDISVVNRKHATEMEAEVLTECIKHIMDTNEGEEEVTAIFLDGIKTGRGYLGGLVDYSEDPIRGDLRLLRLNPLSVYPDPRGVQYDLSDCEYVCTTTWYTVDRLREEYPNKADEIGVGRMPDASRVLFRGGEKNTYEANQGALSSLHDSQVLVEQYWYTTRERVWYVLSPAGLFQFDNEQAVRDALHELQAAGATDGLQVVDNRMRNVLHFATVVGDVILDDTVKPLGEYNGYPIVPYAPYRQDRDDEVTTDITPGVIDNIKDLQMEVNKRRSQQLNIVNTLSHSGYFNKKQGGADSRQLRNLGSTPGAVIDYDEVMPTQITPKTVPQGHMLEEEKAATDMKEVSGINPDLLGYRGERGEPGIVIQMRQQQGSIGLEGLLSNLKRTKKILGKALIGIITQSGLYSPDEILNIIDLTDDPQTTQAKREAVVSLLSNKEVKKFDVEVTTQPTSPSQRIYNFYKLSELVKTGLPVPLDVLIKAGDIPYGDEIIAYNQQMQGMGQGMPNTKAIQDILTGGGKVPPQV